jgi:hypothetical protein
MKNFATYTPTALDTLTSGLLCDCAMQLWFANILRQSLRFPLLHHSLVWLDLTGSASTP